MYCFLFNHRRVASCLGWDVCLQCGESFPVWNPRWKRGHWREVLVAALCAAYFMWHLYRWWLVGFRVVAQ